MDYKNVISGLKNSNQDEVTRYINYLKFIEGEKTREGKIKNNWFAYFIDQQAIDIYKKVAIDNLSIDGETITLQFKGKVMVSYNYQAYKNRVLNVYPETLFDIQNVNDGDDFSFRKESGKVIYSHKINDPFNTKPKIIGAYCIIKNKRGEFLETINMTDIEKMKAVAKTKNVWEQWFSEMVLKSVIKRACKRHFKDITTNIENLDNENVDLELAGFDETIQKKIEEAKTIDEINKLYKAENKNISDKVKFIDLLTERKKELQEVLPEIIKDDHPKAIEMLKSGTKPNILLNHWKIDQETMENLISMAT